MSARTDLPPSGIVVGVITAICGITVIGIGVLALVLPRSFAGMISFPPYNEHLLHDVGAFEIGIGASLLAALIWSDGIVVVLIAFLVGNAVHTVNHVVDRHLGGHTGDAWLLGGLALLAAIGLILRLRGLRTQHLRDHPSPVRKDAR